MTDPSRLTPTDTDQHIYEVMTTWTVRGRGPLVPSRIHNGIPQAWSRTQERWLTVTQYAAEWRHGYQYRLIMGDPETAMAVTRYERSIGL